MIVVMYPVNVFDDHCTAYFTDSMIPPPHIFTNAWGPDV